MDENLYKQSTDWPYFRPQSAEKELLLTCLYVKMTFLYVVVYIFSSISFQKLVNTYKLNAVDRYYNKFWDISVNLIIQKWTLTIQICDISPKEVR